MLDTLSQSFVLFSRPLLFDARPPPKLPQAFSGRPALPLAVDPQLLADTLPISLSIALNNLVESLELFLLPFAVLEVRVILLKPLDSAVRSGAARDLSIDSENEGQ